MSVHSQPEEDPFTEIDELNELMAMTVQNGEACSIDEYVDGEHDVPVCVDLCDWDRNCLQTLCEIDEGYENDCDDKDNDEDNDDQDVDEEIQESNPKVKTCKEVCKYLNEVQRLLENKGQISHSFTVGTVLDSIVDSKVSSLSQSTLHDYLQ